MNQAAAEALSEGSRDTLPYSMDLLAPCPLAGDLACLLRSEQDALTRRWLAFESAPKHFVILIVPPKS